MARRLNTLRLPSVIPEDSQYESDKENDEPVPPTRAEVAAADAALKRMEAALRVSQAVKKPTKSERVARDVARAMAAHARSAGGEDVSEPPRWSDDDAAGRALTESADNWRDDPVLHPGRARRRTLGGRRPRRAVVGAADAAHTRLEAALRVSQAVKKPTKSERVARDVARAMAAHARSAGGEDVSETPRWSDDDAAGRALNEIDDNWRDDPVLNSGRARRRTLGGRRPRRVVPPVPIVSPPPSTERLLRARDRMVQARKRLHQSSPGRSLCEDLGCGCASNEAAPMVGLCAADATECAIQ